MGSSLRTPLLRGPVRLVESFAFLPRVKRALPEAVFPFEGRRMIGMLLATAAATQVVRRARLADSAKELVTALLSLAPAVLSLREGALAAYHGAEHIAIGSYEHDEPRAREHERCGTHLVGPLLVTTALGNVVASRAPAALPQRRQGRRDRRRRRGLDRDLRLDAAPPRDARRAGAREARPRVPAPRRHRRADARPARGRRGGARRLPGARDAVSILFFDVGAWMQNFALTWIPVLLFFVMCVVVWLLWRTTKLMPRVKPMEITPGSDFSVTWSEVAGLDEAKAELQEVVEFLQDPKRFERLGARVPKGILLYGPPGTGKTLAAKAVAHESGARFYAQSASAFVEMFAGLGAARIRKLFEDARKNAPSIVFIDELDAVGQARSGHGFNREQDQTLNQLLVELDGFGPRDQVVVMGASNRLQDLDPALLRPGRFDRQILVQPPDLGGRIAILRVHMRGKPLAGDVDVESIARQTAGLTGADLANICNEAAICAGRRRAELIVQADFDHAMDRVMAGLQQRRAMTDKEMRILAYHEGGHALVSHLMNTSSPVQKATIIARGDALGYTLHMPDEERYLAHEGGAGGLDGRHARRPRRRAGHLRPRHDRRRERPREGHLARPLDGLRVRHGRDAARRARCAPTTTRSPRTPSGSATSSRRTSPRRAYAEALRILTKHRALLDRVAHGAAREGDAVAQGAAGDLRRRRAGVARDPSRSAWCACSAPTPPADPSGGSAALELRDVDGVFRRLDRRTSCSSPRT